MSLHRARLCVLVATATAAGLLLSAAPARADSVSEWDAIAATAVTGPPSNQGATGFTQMAIVHAAMFDAVNAIDHRYKPYLSSPRAKPWFSQDAAVATAAYRVLVDGDVVAEAQRAALKEKLTPIYDAAIAKIAAGRPGTAAFARARPQRGP